MDLQPDGKKKKALDNFVYHLELCTMCNLCIEACPTGAIKMAQTFEHSVFDRSQLTKKLNAPGMLSTFYASDKGVIAGQHEGFVAVDRQGNFVKLVDRSEFSRLNLTQGRFR